MPIIIIIIIIIITIITIISSIINLVFVLVVLLSPSVIYTSVIKQEVFFEQCGSASCTCTLYERKADAGAMAG